MTNHIEAHVLKAIAPLQRPGEPDLLNRIVGLFKSESSITTVALQQGLDSADLPAVRVAAHTVKSSCACVDTRLISERCRDLESASSEDTSTGCMALGEFVQDLMEASIDVLTLHVSTPV